MKKGWWNKSNCLENARSRKATAIVPALALVIAFGLAFSSVVVYLGVNGNIKLFCFLRCDAAGDIRALQAFQFILISLFISSFVFDALIKSRVTLYIIAISIVLFVALKPLMGGRWVAVYFAAIYALACLPYFLFLNVICSAAKNVSRLPKVSIACAAMALGLVLLVPQVVMRWSIVHEARALAGDDFCFYQRTVRTGTVVSHSSYQLTLGRIISVSTPRIYLLSRRGVFEWRFRKLKFELWKRPGPNMRVYGTPRPQDVADCFDALKVRVSDQKK